MPRSDAVLRGCDGGQSLRRSRCGGYKGRTAGGGLCGAPARTVSRRAARSRDRRAPPLSQHQQAWRHARARKFARARSADETARRRGYPAQPESTGDQRTSGNRLASDARTIPESDRRVADLLRRRVAISRLPRWRSDRGSNEPGRLRDADQSGHGFAQRAAAQARRPAGRLPGRSHRRRRCDGRRIRSQTNRQGSTRRREPVARDGEHGPSGNRRLHPRQKRRALLRQALRAPEDRTAVDLSVQGRVGQLQPHARPLLGRHQARDGQSRVGGRRALQDPMGSPEPRRRGRSGFARMARRTHQGRGLRARAGRARAVFSGLLSGGSCEQQAVSRARLLR